MPCLRPIEAALRDARSIRLMYAESHTDLIGVHPRMPHYSYPKGYLDVKYLRTGELRTYSLNKSRKAIPL